MPARRVVAGIEASGQAYHTSQTIVVAFLLGGIAFALIKKNSPVGSAMTPVLLGTPVQDPGGLITSLERRRSSWSRTDAIGTSHWLGEV